MSDNQKLAPTSPDNSILKSVVVNVLSGVLIALILAFPVQRTVKYIVQSITFGGGQVPIGTIVAWNGDGGQPPYGWKICNGLDNTPDLDKLFLRGVTDVKYACKTNGEDIIAVNDIVQEGSTHIGTVDKSLANKVLNVPKHYTVIYIIRVK